MVRCSTDDHVLLVVVVEQLEQRIKVEWHGELQAIVGLLGQIPKRVAVSARALWKYPSSACLFSLRGRAISSWSLSHMSSTLGMTCRASVDREGQQHENSEFGRFPLTQACLEERDAVVVSHGAWPVGGNDSLPERRKRHPLCEGRSAHEA